MNVHDATKIESEPHHGCITQIVYETHTHTSSSMRTTTAATLLLRMLPLLGAVLSTPVAGARVLASMMPTRVTSKSDYRVIRENPLVVSYERDLVMCIDAEAFYKVITHLEGFHRYFHATVAPHVTVDATTDAIMGYTHRSAFLIDAETRKFHHGVESGRRTVLMTCVRLARMVGAVERVIQFRDDDRLMCVEPTLLDSIELVATTYAKYVVTEVMGYRVAGSKGATARGLFSGLAAAVPSPVEGEDLACYDYDMLDTVLDQATLKLRDMNVLSQTLCLTGDCTV